MKAITLQNMTNSYIQLFFGFDDIITISYNMTSGYNTFHTGGDAMNLTRDEVVILLNITRDLFYRMNRISKRMTDEDLKKLEPIIDKLATKLEELEEVSILCPY